jgi:hypothetical protein
MLTTLDNRHKFALPYWARPGIALFAKKTDDGAEGGGGDDDEEDDDDEDDDDEDDDDLGELSEDELRAELKKTRDSLSKASGSSKAKRDKIKRLNAELAEARKPKTDKPKTAAGDDDHVDAEAIKAAAKAEARAESDTRIRKTAARAELKAAGIPADQVGRLIGLIDLDSLDVDDEGEVDGLDDAIDELKADWPQLFNVKSIRRQRKSAAGGSDEKPPRGKLTPSQIQAARATGKRAS